MILHKTTSKIHNLKQLAISSMDANDCNTALEYINKALELNIADSEIWFLKLQCLTKQETMGNPNTDQIIETIRKTINHAKEESKEYIEFKVYDHELNAIEFRLDATIKALEDKETLELLRKLYYTIKQEKPNSAPYEVMQMDEEQMKMCKTVTYNVIVRLQELPDDKIASYPKLLDKFINCLSYIDRIKEAEKNRYKVYGIKDTSDIEIALDNTWMKRTEDLNNKTRNIQSLSQSQRQKKKNDYWNAHSEEYKALINQMEQLNRDCKNFQDVLSARLNELRRITDAVKRIVCPLEDLDNRLKKQIADLEDRRSNLSIFKGKEKKEIAERIANLTSKRPSHNEICAEKQRTQAQYAPQIDALQQEINQLKNAIAYVNQEVNRIRNELEKDR